MDDINKLMDDSKWKEALAAISRVSVLTGAAATPYDHHKLLLAKAECQIQLHQNADAVATLNTLKKEAKDPAEAAEPIALTELLRTSPAGIYTPKTGAGKAPISILDRSRRKDAYAALAADQLVTLQTRVKNAANVTSLPPLVEIGKAAAPVRAAELAATGKTDQVDAVTAQLAAQSQKLMTNALGELSKRVEAISASANKQITLTVPANFGRGGSMPVQQVRPQGLTANDIQNLKSIEQECDKFTPASKELAQAFGDDKGFASVSAQATGIKSRAESVLNANYEGSGIGAPIAPGVYGR
jgi:hypothetical protein